MPRRPPSFVSGVFMIGNFACECAGPQNGASTQRVPAAILPRRHRAPAAGILEVHFFVAEERRLVERRLVIGAAERLRIEQVHPAFLAGGRHQLASLEGEDRRRVVRIEIALAQPVPVGRRVVVLQLQLVAGDLDADDAVAVARRIAGRIVDAVAGRGPRGAGRVDHGAAPSPRAAAPGVEVHDLVLRIVEPHRRDAVAGVGVRHPEHVADQVQAPALAGVEHERRLQILAGGGVEHVEHAVAGDEVDRPAPLRIGRTDHRRVAAAARPEEAEVRRIRGLPAAAPRRRGRPGAG